MEFSALNVDFSSLRIDPLDSRRPLHAGFKEGYPHKKNRYFAAVGLSSACRKT